MIERTAHLPSCSCSLLGILLFDLLVHKISGTHSIRSDKHLPSPHGKPRRPHYRRPRKPSNFQSSAWRESAACTPYLLGTKAAASVLALAPRRNGRPPVRVSPRAAVVIEHHAVPWVGRRHKPWSTRRSACVAPGRPRNLPIDTNASPAGTLAGATVGELDVSEARRREAAWR